MRFLDIVDPEDILLDGDEILPGVIYQEVPAHCFTCGHLTHTFDVCHRLYVCSSDCRSAQYAERQEAYETTRSAT